MYIVIYDQPVYMTRDKLEKLRHNSSLTIDEQFSLHIKMDGKRDEKLWDKFSEESYDYLKTQYDENPSDFMEEWARFDISNETDLNEEFMDIMRNYCLFYNHSRASYSDGIVSIYSIQKTSFIDKLRNKSPKRLVFSFSMNDIIRVSGHLRQFFIELRGGTQLYMSGDIHLSLERVRK